MDTRASLPPATISLTTCKCLTPSWRALNSFRSNPRHSRRMEWRMDNRKMVCCVISIASFPGLPRFCSSVCIQYDTRKRKSGKNREGLGTLNHVNDVRWTQSGHREGAWCPTASTGTINLRASSLPVKRSTRDLVNVWGRA